MYVQMVFGGLFNCIWGGGAGCFGELIVLGGAGCIGGASCILVNWLYWGSWLYLGGGGGGRLVVLYL